jgi:RNA-directed DNA polymerase
VASGHGTGVRSGEVNSQMPDMYAIRKSDGNIVPKKQANKEGVSSAESVEGRAPTKRNTGQLPTVRTQGRGAVSSRLAGVRQAAQRRKDERFTALLHHVSVELLRKSYYDLKHNAAAGVDNVVGGIWEVARSATTRPA